MTNEKYYLKSVDLIDDKENGNLFYQCIYSNGILQHIKLLPINMTVSINIPTIYEKD